MPSYPTSVLYTADANGYPCELINGSRTADRLTDAGGCGGYFSDVLEDLGCPASAFVPVCVTNLLSAMQSDFNGGTTGWIADTNCAIANDTGVKYEGAGSLRMTASGSGTMIARTTPTGLGAIAVLANLNYTVRARFRANTTGRTCRISVKWYDGAGTLISETYTGSVVDSSSGWNEHAHVVTAPSNAATAAVFATVVSAGAGEIHRVDTVALIPQVAPTSIQLPWVVGGGGVAASTAWLHWDSYQPTAPWDNGVAAADEAYGYIVEEWTGLDGQPHVRSQSPIGTRRGGARLGPQSHRARVMKLNLLLLGSSERGLEHLFRYLESRLLDCCGPCCGRSIFLRTHCPGDDDVDSGWVRLDRIGLVEGPTWESEPARGAGCSVRRVSFTIVAGDPCMYGASSGTTSSTASISGASLSTSTAIAGCDAWASTSRTVSASIPAFDAGSGAAKVVISSPFETDAYGDPKSLPDLRIFGYEAADFGTATACNAPWAGELILCGYQAAGMEIELDFGAGTIRHRHLGAGIDWEDGSQFLGRALPGGRRRWWTFGPGRAGTVVVEPVYVGLLNSIGATADPVSEWTVSIEGVQRIGCC